jgi:hypothetical protein
VRDRHKPDQHIPGITVDAVDETGASSPSWSASCRWCWLRSGDGPQVVSIQPRPSRFAESTISSRLRAVTSCYRFHELNGVALGGDLMRVVHGGGKAVYKPMLEHVARRKGRQRPVIRVRVPRHVPPPVLTPGQIEAICAACARFDPASGRWTGLVRDRLLWALLAETGFRLGEALGLQHRDWHTGRGDTPFIEVVPRDHPHGVRVKGGRYRRVSSPMSWTGSTGSTCGSCARPASTCRSPTSTPRRCS